MSPTEADVLAKKIINAWRGGPSLDVWIEALQQLDAGTAGTAYIRLVGELEHPPSIAAFRKACTRLHTASRDEKCVECGNDGWVTAPYPDRAGNRCAIPCGHCEHGRLAARWWHTSPVLNRPATSPGPVVEDAPPVDLFTNGAT